MNDRLLIVLILMVSVLHVLSSNTYYLIDLDKNLSTNHSYCSSLMVDEQFYRIPKHCHHHLQCDAYRCDDSSFRCIKIREALCCLHRHLQAYCPIENSVRTKDLFRSVYFHMSIEHGYCEINLERIEKRDVNYCLASEEESTITTTRSTTTTLTSTTISVTRSTFKHYHRRLSTLRPLRNRHRIAARQNYSSLSNIDFLQQVTIIEQYPTSKALIKSKTLSVFITVLILLRVF